MFGIETNLVATARPLDLCVRAGLKNLIVLSSGRAVQGVPKRLPIAKTHPTDLTVS